MSNPAEIEMHKIRSIIHSNESLKRILGDFRTTSFDNYLNDQIDSQNIGSSSSSSSNASSFFDILSPFWIALDYNF